MVLDFEQVYFQNNQFTEIHNIAFDKMVYNNRLFHLDMQLAKH